MSKRTTFAPLAIALAVALALAGCGEALPTPPSREPMPQQNATPTPAASIVAYIGGYALTHAEFLERRAIVEEGVASMERDVRDVFPNPKSDIDREFYSILLEQWPPRIAILKSYGNDAVAFAELVYEYALMAAAIRAGHTVSDDEVAAFMKEQSANLDLALSDPAAKSEMSEFLAESGGRESYLAKVAFPAKRNLLIGKHLRASYERMGIDHNDFEAIDNARWKVLRLAVAAVEIELMGTPKIDASPEKVIAYMNEGEALDASKSLRAATPTSTPTPTARPTPDPPSGPVSGQ